MEFVVESIRFKPYHPAWEEFRSSRNQPIGRDLIKRGLRLQALARASVPKRTGLLAISIRVNYKTALNPSVVIGSNVPYAYWVHEGTRRHKIRIHNARVLRFVVHGRVVYAQKQVDHPGTRPTKFLSKHLHTVVR